MSDVIQKKYPSKYIIRINKTDISVSHSFQIKVEFYIKRSLVSEIIVLNSKIFLFFKYYVDLLRELTKFALFSILFPERYHKYS